MNIVLTKYPTGDKYQSAMQCPRACFINENLQKAIVEKDLRGLPIPRSGGFAISYAAQIDNHKHALKCFTKPSPDRDYRYKQICQYLSECNSDLFVKVDYLEKGIRIDNLVYPITIMDWIEGDTLEKYLKKHVGDREALNNLIFQLQRADEILMKYRIGHGDLCHSNIIIRNNRIVLIDFDGLFIPRFAGYQSNELGHIHFQHPNRNGEYFNEKIDRFSEITLFLSFKALLEDRYIANDFVNNKFIDDGILFSRSDFISPNNSQLLVKMSKNPALFEYADLFKKICRNNIEFVPTLTEFIEKRQIANGIHEWIVSQPEKNNQYDEIDAFNLGEVWKKIGLKVTIYGKITDIHRGVDKNGKPYYFLNFGDWKDKCLTAVIWSNMIPLFISTGIDPMQYEGKNIRITGVLSNYNDRPEILLDSPRAIQVDKMVSGKKEKEEESIPDNKTKMHDLNRQFIKIARIKSTYVSGSITQPKITYQKKTVQGNYLNQAFSQQSNAQKDKINSLYSNNKAQDIKLSNPIKKIKGVDWGTFSTFILILLVMLCCILSSVNQ